METIKIVMFVLGLFFGEEISTVIPEKTTITITPKTKTIVIHQENLLAIYPKEKDSLFITKEFSTIYAKKDNWNADLAAYLKKSIVYSSPEKGVLNAKITLEYSNTKDLKVFAIDISREGKFSIINIPRWYLATEDGELNGNYWSFDADKEFSFSLSPVKDVPETYTVNNTILHNVWKALSKK